MSYIKSKLLIKMPITQVKASNNLSININNLQLYTTVEIRAKLFCLKYGLNPAAFSMLCLITNEWLLYNKGLTAYRAVKLIKPGCVVKGTDLTNAHNKLKTLLKKGWLERINTKTDRFYYYIPALFSLERLKELCDSNL